MEELRALSNLAKSKDTEDFYLSKLERMLEEPMRPVNLAHSTL